jgi:hypothetical protein
VDIQLTYDQRARLELLSIQAGMSTAQMLTEAAQKLLDEDAGLGWAARAGETQKFLSEGELEVRLAGLLRY